MALSDLIDIAKYSSGYHAHGSPAATPDYGFLFNQDGGNTDKKQVLALKLLQMKAQLQAQQAQAALKQKQLDVWNSVGTPTVTDKSTGGDVTNIVDSEEVGGRDAGVVNDGAVAGNADKITPTIPSDTQSSSSLVNMMKGLQPTISTAGNMILTRKKSDYQGAAKHYDEARTFDYAKRLADQSIIQSGKTKRDIAPEDYKTLVNDNIPKAETYLYGRPISQQQPADATDPNADTTGITTAIKTAMSTGQGAAPAPASQAIAPQVKGQTIDPALLIEGKTTASNKDGKRLMWKGGRWVPLN